MTIADLITSSANSYGIPPSLSLSIAQHESGLNPNAVHTNNNGTKDWGVMQLNDTTVRTLGVSNPLDPQQNVNAANSLLSGYLNKYNGDTTLALWAYADGPGAVANGSMSKSAKSLINNYAPGVNSPDLSLESIGSSDTYAYGDSLFPSADLLSNIGLDSGMTIGLGLLAALMAYFIFRD